MKVKSKNIKKSKISKKQASLSHNVLRSFFSPSFSFFIDSNRYKTQIHQKKSNIKTIIADGIYFIELYHIFIIKIKIIT